MLDEVRVTGVGLPDVRGASGRTLYEALADDATAALDEATSRTLQSDDDVDGLLRRTIRARLKHAWKKRPQILVEVFRVDD